MYLGGSLVRKEQVDLRYMPVVVVQRMIRGSEEEVLVNLTSCPSDSSDLFDSVWSSALFKTLSLGADVLKCAWNHRLWSEPRWPVTSDLLGRWV